MNIYCAFLSPFQESIVKVNESVFPSGDFALFFCKVSLKCYQFIWGEYMLVVFA